MKANEIYFKQIELLPFFFNLYNLQAKKEYTSMKFILN